MTGSCAYHWGENPDYLGPLSLDYYYMYTCAPDGTSFLVVLAMFLWVAMLMNLLAQTASNYFSPTLSKICENLHLAYDIAGVTFLALGNGAPDFFSLIASFSGGVDVLVGVGALLGGSMFVCTVVVGSIGLLCPCEVSRTLFLRDIGFHLLAVCCVALLGLLQQVTIGFAIALLALYAVYVAAVLLGSWYTARESEGESAHDPIFGDIGMSSLLTATPQSSSVQTAFWHPNASSASRIGRKKMQQRTYSPIPDKAANNSNNTGIAGYTFVTLPNADDDDFSRSISTGEHDEEDVESVAAGAEDVEHTINLSGVFQPNLSEIIHEDFFTHQRSALSQQEDPPRESPLHSSLDEALLSQDASSSSPSLSHSPSQSQRFSLLQSKLRKYGELLNRNATKYQHVLSALYWQQWALTRHAHAQHTVLFAEWQAGAWYERIYLLLELPAVIARDLTIPQAETQQWNKFLAVLHPLTDSLMLFFLSGKWSEGVGPLPAFVFCLLVSAPFSLYLYLFSTTTRAPTHTGFALCWSLLGFVMNVAWIFLLAGELVDCLSVLGVVLDIPPAFLGLTVLAWGNSVGDFFTNTAVAKQGLGAMAIAGCYGGPVFNLLVGFGTALLYAASTSYPAPFPVLLDTSSIVSLVFLLFALTSTMILIPLRNYQLDQVFGIYLIALYVVYSIVQAMIVVFA